MIGKKIGMSCLYNKNGSMIPVTIIDVSNNFVTQIKNIKKDKYFSIQISYGKNKISSNMKKPLIGHFYKSKTKYNYIIKEFKNKRYSKFNLGERIKINIFNLNQKVSIKGKSIGKGFSGTIKRHNFSSGRASHGNSRSHKSPGSVGMCQDPGRVFKGKKMCGQLGNKNCTIRNLEILKIDNKNNLL